MTPNQKTTRDFVLLGLLLWWLWPRTTVNTTFSYGPEVGGTGSEPPAIAPLPAPPPSESGDYLGQLRANGGTMYEWDGGSWVLIAQGSTYVQSGAQDAADIGPAGYSLSTL